MVVKLGTEKFDKERQNTKIQKHKKSRVRKPQHYRKSATSIRIHIDTEFTHKTISDKMKVKNESLT